MADSDNEPACPEAAVHGGCPGRDDQVAPRSFSCPVTECPVVARANDFHGITVTAMRLGCRVVTAVIVPFPAANDNKPD